MNINNSLITKIDNIVKLSGEFDDLFFSLIKKNYKTEVEKIEKLYKLTQLFIFIRSEHGAVLMLIDRKKEQLKEQSSELSEKLVNELYELSTFTSVLENISNLVSNIDFEFKRIAVIFPKYINKKPMTLILLTNDIDKNSSYVQMIEKVKEVHPEHIYKVIECSKGDKVNCGKIGDKKINVTASKIPIMFLINENNIVELPMQKIKNEHDLENILN
jgi:hypothetical protein